MNPELCRKSTEDMIKYFILFLLVVVILANLDFYPDKTTTYSISSSQTTHAAFGQCDATNEYMYFTYWGNDSRVEIYDRNASFLCSIIFDDSSNGRMYIRCDENLLYVKLRNDIVYIFSGTEEIAKMAEDEANALGYTNQWFKNADSKLRVKDGFIYLLDSEGKDSARIAKPSSIIVQSSDSILGWTSNYWVIVLLAILLLVGLLLWLIKNRSILRH